MCIILLSFGNVNMERTKGETKFSLGRDLYLTVNMWNGQPKIHIRKFKTLRSLVTPGKVNVIPTRFGVCLERKQFEEIIKNSPAIFSELYLMTGESTDAGDTNVAIDPVPDNGGERSGVVCGETSYGYSPNVEYTPKPSNLRQRVMDQLCLKTEE